MRRTAYVSRIQVLRHHDRMPNDSQQQRVTDMLRSLEHDEAGLESAIRRIRDEFPAYAPVSDEQLVASAQRNQRIASRTLLAGEVPSADAIWEAETGVAERLEAGVPIEDIMGGFRVSMSLIQDRLVSLATEHGVSSEEVVKLTGLLWQLSDAMSARSAFAYRQQGLALAVAEQRRRDAWLLALLTGGMDSVRLEQGITTYHLDRDAEYVPFCTEPRPEADLETLQKRLSRHFRESTTMMLPSTGQLVGILPRMPPAIEGHLLAVGPAAMTPDLAAAYDVARSVLAAAAMQFHEGVHTVASLGWRLGVPLAPAVTNLVRGRYLAPLHDSGIFGEQVIEALRAWLVHDRSIPLTAKALHVHVNTLRYRLSRFEELTGRALSNSDTIAELAWALHAGPSVS